MTRGYGFPRPGQKFGVASLFDLTRKPPAAAEDPARQAAPEGPQRDGPVL